MLEFTFARLLKILCSLSITDSRPSLRQSGVLTFDFFARRGNVCATGLRDGVLKEAIGIEQLYENFSLNCLS